MTNFDIAKKLLETANLLAQAGENSFKVSAFRKAAVTVRDYDLPLEQVADLTSISGIGKSLAEEISQIIKTGTSERIQTLYKQTGTEDSAAYEELLRIPGLGPVRVKQAIAKGIKTIAELRTALDAGIVFSVQFDERVKQGLAIVNTHSERLPWALVSPMVEKLIENFKLSGIRAEVAGSYRRKKSTVKDIDIVCVAEGAAKKLAQKIFSEAATEVLAVGDGKCRIAVKLENGQVVQVDLAFTEEKSFGATLQYLTGSKEHNIAIRKITKSRGWLLNEHGLWNEKGEWLAGENEEGIYTAIGLVWVEPDKREGDNLTWI